MHNGFPSSTPHYLGAPRRPWPHAKTQLHAAWWPHRPLPGRTPAYLAAPSDLRRHRCIRDGTWKAGRTGFRCGTAHYQAAPWLPQPHPWFTRRTAPFLSAPESTGAPSFMAAPSIAWRHLGLPSRTPRSLPAPGRPGRTPTTGRTPGYLCAPGGTWPHRKASPHADWQPAHGFLVST